MTRYQKFQAAIEAFEPGAGNTPIVCTTTEVNEKVFNILAGRKLKLWTTGSTVVLLVSALILLAATVVNAIAWRNVGGAAPAPAVFIPVVIMLLLRTTLVTFDENGLNFFFLEIRFGGYRVSDKMTLPFDQITGMKVKPGAVLKRNTYFTFIVTQNGKTRKIKTSTSAKLRKVPEQQDNLKELLQTLENKNFPAA